MLRRLSLVTLAAALLLALAPGAQALDINIIPGASLSANPQALDSFNRAAQQWERRFSDPITVNINANLAALGSGILGSTDTVMLYGGYNTIRTAMVADAAPYANNAIVAYLPTVSEFSAYVPSGFGLTGDIGASKANLKALGFTGLDGAFGARDATITFSTGFSFTYNHHVGGVTPGTIDFETVAAHEIGHALGFISVVDAIDYYKSLGLTGDVYPYSLDLFRFGKDISNPSNYSGFTNNPRMLVPGQEAIFDDLTSEYRMSTGSEYGDGRQASHWKDDALLGSFIGLLDPTLGYGVYFDVAEPDVRAMDLIGYDLVLTPVPGAFWLLGSGLLGLAALRFRRRR
ncbi:MAG: hypothetical protein FJ134_08650 [Deltaproteobacteria bacterium]|nr:hypothetical protein [Deltaproteobacteria bacterium]